MGLMYHSKLFHISLISIFKVQFMNQGDKRVKFNFTQFYSNSYRLNKPYVPRMTNYVGAENGVDDIALLIQILEDFVGHKI